MSDSNRTSFSLSKEPEWGKNAAGGNIPDGTAVLRRKPATSDQLNGNKVTTTRRTMQPNRMSKKSRRTGLDIQGTTGHEFTVQDSEDLFSTALADNGITLSLPAAAYTTDAAAGTITAGAGTPFTDADPALDWGVIQPRFVRIQGGLQSGTNGVKRIIAIADSVLTLAPGEITTNEVAVPLALETKIYQNGTDLVSFLAQRHYADTGDYFWFSGLVGSQMVLSAQPRDLYGLEVTWTGRDHDLGRISSASGYVMQATFAAGLSQITITNGIPQLYAGQPFKLAGDDTLYEFTEDVPEDEAGGDRSVSISPPLVEDALISSSIELHTDSKVSAGAAVELPDFGNEALNTSSDTKSAWLNGVDIRECFTNLSLTFDNSQRPKQCLFKETVSKPGQNRYRLTGSLNFHFENVREYRRFLLHKTNTFSVLMEDPDGNAVGITLEAFTYETSPGPGPSGEDQDIVLSLSIDSHEPEQPGAPSRYVAVEFFPAP